MPVDSLVCACSVSLQQQHDTSHLAVCKSDETVHLSEPQARSSQLYTGKSKAHTMQLLRVLLVTLVLWRGQPATCKPTSPNEDPWAHTYRTQRGTAQQTPTLQLRGQPTTAAGTAAEPHTTAEEETHDAEAAQEGETASSMQHNQPQAMQAAASQPPGQQHADASPEATHPQQQDTTSPPPAQQGALEQSAAALATPPEAETWPPAYFEPYPPPQAGCQTHQQQVCATQHTPTAGGWGTASAPQQPTGQLTWPPAQQQQSAYTWTTPMQPHPQPWPHWQQAAVQQQHHQLPAPPQHPRGWMPGRTPNEPWGYYAPAYDPDTDPWETESDRETRQAAAAMATVHPHPQQQHQPGGGPDQPHNTMTQLTYQVPPDTNRWGYTLTYHPPNRTAGQGQPRTTRQASSRRGHTNSKRSRQTRIRAAWHSRTNGADQEQEHSQGDPLRQSNNNSGQAEGPAAQHGWNPQQEHQPMRATEPTQRPQAGANNNNRPDTTPEGTDPRGRGAGPGGPDQEEATTSHQAQQPPQSPHEEEQAGSRNPQSSSASKQPEQPIRNRWGRPSSHT